MSALWLLLLASTFAPAAPPLQNPINPPDAGGTIVLKFSWSKERLGWERDPFGGPVENYEEMRLRARNEKRIDDAKRGGSSAEVERLRRDARTDAAIVERQRGKAPPARYVFLYKASVKNGARKASGRLTGITSFAKPAPGARSVVTNSPAKKRSARARAKN